MTDSMSGEDIYDNFRNATGAEGIAASAALVKQLADRHHERVERLQRLKTRMESAWQGAAAGAAQRGLGPLVTEHAQSGYALLTAQDLTSRQSGSFGRAKNDVVPVPAAPDEMKPLVILTQPEAAATYYKQLTEHTQAAQHNVDVMNSYTGASRYNTERQPGQYGDIVDDQAGITIGSPTTVDTDGSTESTSDSEAQEAGRRSGGEAGDREPGVNDGPRAGSTTEPVAGQENLGHTTRPEGHSSTTVPSSLSPNPEPVLGQGRPVTGGGIVPGIGIGLPVDSLGSDRVAGPPRGGGAIGGIPLGRGVGAEAPGATVRSGPGGGAVIGSGRGGVGFGGVPVGGGGRGRGDEDVERRTPPYLEGDDPEDLFDTDQLTAPPTIGAEDD